MTIAEALSAELARQGVSLNELAKRAGMRPASAHDVLSGTTANPGILTVGKLLAALGKTLSWPDRRTQ